MTDKQINLLKNALDIYEYVLDLFSQYSFDDDLGHQLSIVRKELSEMIGQEV